MEVTIAKHVTVKGKTNRGAEFEINGSVGMTTLKVKGNSFVFYTDELPAIVEALTKFNDEIKKPI